MKKIFLGALIICFLFLVSACGLNEKTLSCSSNNEQNNIIINGKSIYKFKDDKLSTGYYDVVFKYNKVNNVDSLWASFKSQLEEQNEEVDIKGYKSTINFNDKNYEFSAKANIDFEKISDDDLKKYNLSQYKNKSYDELKEYLEKEEKQTCK